MYLFSYIGGVLSIVCFYWFGSMSKRGSPYLRRAIWLASTVAVHRDPMFQTYYEKKISEGLHYMNVIGHVSRKMTAVIFAVLRDGQPYQPILQSAG